MPETAYLQMSYDMDEVLELSKVRRYPCRNIPCDGKVLAVKEDQRDQCTGALGKGRFPKESEVGKETRRTSDYSRPYSSQ